MPAAYPLQDISKTMPASGQFFNPFVISRARTAGIHFLRCKLDRQVDIAQSLDLRFQHAPEKNHPGYLAEEIGIAVDQVHPVEELL